MKEERFDELLESVREGFAILRGERKPARVFYYPSRELTTAPQEMYAICLETDDPELLQVRKLYHVRLLSGGLVSSSDEAGRSRHLPGGTVYPS